MLENHEVQPGARVKAPDGQEYEVVDTLQGGTTLNPYLIVQRPGPGQFGTIVPAGIVREEYEAVDPEEAQASRDAEWADVTDEPDVTDDKGSSQSPSSSATPSKSKK